MNIIIKQDNLWIIDGRLVKVVISGDCEDCVFSGDSICDELECTNGLGDEIKFINYTDEY